MRVAVAEDALDAYMNSGMDLKLYQPKAMVRMQSRTLALILSEHAFVSSGVVTAWASPFSRWNPRRWGTRALEQERVKGADLKVV